jgi:hypothetical protein
MERSVAMEPEIRHHCEMESSNGLRWTLGEDHIEPCEAKTYA